MPTGVDADTWIGFEARIQERRFNALLRTIDAALTASDGVAARIALEELRELRPAARELPELAARVALLPVGSESAAAVSYLWWRSLGAVTTFVVGIGLVVGIESMRSGESTAAAVAVARPAVTAPAVTQPASPALAVVLPAAPSTAEDETASVGVSAPVETQPVQAIAVQTESRREEPVGTTGVRSSSSNGRTADVPNRSTFRETAQPSVESAAAPREVPVDNPASSVGSDNRPGYAEVVPAASAPIAANIARQPVSITEPPPPVPPANTRAASAIATPSRPSTTNPIQDAASAAQADGNRVAQVLNRYARAYGDLDPRAASAVWPTVDERALSRAFASLESQDVSFDNCTIDVNGATASALCHGRTSYVGKVGNRQLHTEPRQWRFELKLQGDDWKIARADVR
ncbi:MAG TPA: hypothetical protein VL173_18855 [Vicinamibacterales bacterium]|nr:hypothetical protein [Vicinamibacterales bacterium]